MKILVATLLIGSIFASKLPVTVAVEGKGGYLLTDKLFFGELKVNIEKEFDVLSGFTIGLENTLAFEEPALSDELGLDLKLGVTDFLTFGAGPKLFFSKGTTLGVRGLMIFGYESEKYLFSIENENDFLFIPTDNSKEYVNKLCIEKMFELKEDISLGLAFENELLVTADEISDGFLIGPKLSINNFTFFANYAVGVIPGINHGVEIGFAYVK